MSAVSDLMNSQIQGLGNVIASGDWKNSYATKQDAVDAYNKIAPYVSRPLMGPAQSAPQATPPAAPTNLGATWQYRPANNYAQYNAPAATTGYGRSPLAPFVPQMNGVTARPSAASLLGGIARAAPIGTAAPAAPAAMASGGAVRGVGGGQDDNQLRKSKVGSFIIPADVVSHLGDGNTDEGHRRIQQAESRIRYACGGSVGYAGGGPVAGSQAVPVALSPGEHEVPADVVSMLGNGSNPSGANQLHAMINHVRAHKKTNKGLPPKAKSPLSYMNKSAIPQNAQPPQSPLMA